MAATTYAIVQTGGKQYRVTPGDVLEVERLEASEGDTVELAEVLAVVQDGKATIGTPLVQGARVRAEVLHQGRDGKLYVFKFKAKDHYRRKTGHRQPLTRLAIKEIAVS